MAAEIKRWKIQENWRLHFFVSRRWPLTEKQTYNKCAICQEDIIGIRGIGGVIDRLDKMLVYLVCISGNGEKRYFWVTLLER